MLEKIQRGSCRRRVEDEVKVCALCAASKSVSQTRAARVEHCAMPMLKMKSGSKTFCAHQGRRRKKKQNATKETPRSNKQQTMVSVVRRKANKREIV